MKHARSMDRNPITCSQGKEHAAAGRAREMPAVQRSVPACRRATELEINSASFCRLRIVECGNSGFGQIQLTLYPAQHFVIYAAFITQLNCSLAFDAQRL